MLGLKHLKQMKCNEEHIKMPYIPTAVGSSACEQESTVLNEMNT